jgi:hypothetical protein
MPVKNPLPIPRKFQASVTFDRDHLLLAKKYGGVPVLIPRGRRLALAIRLPNGEILHDFRKEISALTNALTNKIKET